jgi:hypothetical protein
MNEREFYNRYVRKHLTNDRARNRMLYNDTKDSLHKSGQITDRQVKNWVYPDTLAFTSPSQKRNTRNFKKRRSCGKRY